MNDAFERAMRDAVTGGAASPATRERWVTEALAAAGAPTRTRFVAIVAATAAAIVFGAWLFGPGADRPARTDGPPADRPASTDVDVDVERRQNERALEAAVKAGRFARTKPHAVVCIAGGEVIVGDWFDANFVRDAMDLVLARAHERHPHARHRFVFSLDEERRVPGDVILDRSPFRVLSVGAWFLQHVGAVPERVGDEWRVTRGARRAMTAKQRLEFDLATEPGGGFRARPPVLGLPLIPESMAPLVFNENFGLPRFETPGRMIVEDADGHWRAFRRYTVRVRHDALGIDRWVDAIGRGSREAIAPGNWIAVRLGTRVFHGLRRPAPEVARTPGNPIVVLRFGPGDTKRLGALIGAAGDAFDGWRQHAIPNQPASRLDRYDRDGNRTGTLDLATADVDALRAFLRR